ncbi:AMP-binding protein [Colwellia sp. MEBiC06753]
MTLLSDLTKFQHSSAIAIESAEQSITYQQLFEQVNALTDYLEVTGVESVAIYAENSLQWIVIDLACQQAGVIFTPIPLFFSQEQVINLIDSVKPELIFSDRLLPIKSVNKDISQVTNDCVEFGLSIYQLPQTTKIDAPKACTKVTYTSCSTGSPKGVCLTTEQQLNVANALVQRIAIEQARHLCLLPLPTLLENIAGVYSPLLSGGTVVIARDAERGFEGSRLIDAKQLVTCISKVQPNSLILVPELLLVLVGAVKQGWQPPTSLKFIAVGGSKVASALLTEARALSLPVYQGYGLSECASVVSLSTSDNDDINCAGSILPHVNASIRENQLVVTGNTFLGYLEDKSSWYPTEVLTGDIAELNNEQLFITGRAKNMMINSFGRNISPEWLEAEIIGTGLFVQAVVIGDAKPYCIALLVPASAQITQQHVDQVLSLLNAKLPDYARIKANVLLSAPMRFEEGLYTANGRPKRDAIETKFQSIIEQQYQSALYA